MKPHRSNHRTDMLSVRLKRACTVLQNARLNLDYCDVLREARIHRTNGKSQTNMLFYHKED